MNAKDTLYFLENLSPDISVLLIAKHGVGKSSLVKQVAQSVGGFYDVRLSQCEVGDIKGYPVPDKEAGIMKFLKPYWWPRDMSSSGILFFDELNRATGEVQQSVFEICLDRRLDGDELPKEWRVVAAINGSDEYDVSEMDPALLDRWFVIDFDPTVDEWIEWGEANQIHPAILEFIGADHFRLDPPNKGLEPGRVYPSRRSWDRFNSQMSKMNMWKSNDYDNIMRLASGFVGLELSVAFASWFKTQFKSVRPEDVLKSFSTNKKVRSGVARLSAEIGEISSFCNAVSILVKQKGTLTEKEFGNIKALFREIPAEAASSLHSRLMKVKAYPAMVTTEVQAGDSEFMTFIASLYVNSKSSK